MSVTKLQRFFKLTTMLAVAMTAAGVAAAQPQAAGGKTTSEAATSAKPAASAKPARKTSPEPVKPRPAVANRKPSSPTTTGAIPNIAGKWWTTGNGFGDSEVVLSQTGADVSGVIRYADGRSGTITGRMVGKRLQHSWTNSSGEGGSGWLELSWNNFLGGPWRSQQVRDGSWTLSRIEGNWCFGGSRNRIRRITHDAQGRISMVTEDGSHEEGHLEGPWIFLHSDFGSIKGDVDFRANRVNWSTGFYWTWCGR
jgi:hypothetical protein